MESDSCTTKTSGTTERIWRIRFTSTEVTYTSNHGLHFLPHFRMTVFTLYLTSSRGYNRYNAPPFAGILSSWPDIINIHRTFLTKRREYQRQRDEGKVSAEDYVDINRRTDVVTYATLAEITHFQQERVGSVNFSRRRSPMISRPWRQRSSINEFTVHSSSDRYATTAR